MRFSKLLIFFLFVGILFSKEKFSFSHKIKSDESGFKKVAVKDTLKILGLMVEFQSDDISETTGSGQFDLTEPSPKIIDPPPHNANYFTDHLLFAKNYFTKSSNGKFKITSSVIPQKIVVSKKMKEYSPAINKNGLAELISESWKIADSLNPTFAFENYDLFVIFHAGVGLDIDLVSIYGFNPTPYDLPSIYFSLNSLQKIYGTSFNGIQLKNRNFKITNSAILPESESREFSSFGSKYLFQLSINGLLASSIGSHIGLPDLFNTKNGSSGIGRFGLMDGQAIFSLYGVSPPEPSAWEKIYLGWATPKNIFLKDTSLIINSVGGNIVDEIYKIPINQKEYFLIENRNRDAEKNGIEFTIKYKSNIEKKIFLYDSLNGTNNIVDSLYGVIIDIENPDWSLPGYISKKYNLDGGILVWHIDENIIDKRISTNEINSDKNLKGVDLEEADGSQDIGEIYGFTSGGSGSEEGTPFDFWYKGNIAPRFNNSFSNTTTPNSKSNSFAKSGISLKDFSESGNSMSFKLVADENSYYLENYFKFIFPISKVYSVDLKNSGIENIVFTSGDSIFVDFKLKSVIGGKFNLSFAEGKIYSAIDSSLIIISETISKINIGSKIILPIAINSKNELIISTQNGIYKYSGNQLVKINESVPSSISIIDTIFIFSGQNKILFSADKSISFGNLEIVNSNFCEFKVDGRIKYFGIVLLSDKSIYLLNYYGNDFEKIKLSTTSNFTNWTFVDFDKNGEPEVILGETNSLKIFNSRGVLVSNFPFKTQDNGEIISSPTVLAKATGEQNILVGSSNGHIYAINENGKIVQNFPIQSANLKQTPILLNSKLLSASSDSTISIWNIENYFNGYKTISVGELIDLKNSSILKFDLPRINKSEKLIPKNLAYNYPNPVYGEKTFIRYFLSNNANVKIRIFTTNGEIIKEVNQNGIGNLDNEYELDTSNYETGVYIAQIEASSNNATEKVQIKIAVIK